MRRTPTGEGVVRKACFEKTILFRTKQPSQESPVYIFNKISLKTSPRLTYVSVCSTDTKRIYTSSLMAILWPRHGLERDLQARLFERNYACPVSSFKMSQKRKDIEHLLFGFGFLKLILGGMVRFSKAKVILMRLVMPEAPSECPTFGFTYVVSI